MLHGVMRFEERTTSDLSAKRLLKDPLLMKTSARFYLEARARSSRATRFSGGVITTLQGVSTGLLGARLLTEGEGDWNVLGYILAVGGTLTSAVGIIHFFGKPHAERKFHKALKTLNTQNQASTSFVRPHSLTMQLNPTIVHDGVTSHAGLSLAGSF